jgi:hypothetical protein
MTSSFRAAVIQEWRGLPERAPSRDRWQPTSQLLPALMQKLGLKERLRESEVIDRRRIHRRPVRTGCAP